MGQSVMDRQTDLPSAKDREKLQIKLRDGFAAGPFVGQQGPRYDLRI